MSEPVEVPLSFICPISNKIMKDPVQDKEGKSYERKAILKWLKQKKEPLGTHALPEESDLVPNLTLKAEIEAFKKQNHKYKMPSKLDSGPGATLLPLTSESNLKIPLQLQGYNTTIPGKEPVNYTIIKVNTSEPSKRVPVHICCIVDVSGSMQIEVEVKTDAGTTENNGLSRLDLVKHALNTIVHSLKEEDAMTLVKFSSDAEVLFSGMQTREDNKSKILEHIKNLDPNGGTNLWAGLKLGVETMSKCSGKQVKAIYLLTDGSEPDTPPEGHEYQLNKLLQSNPCNCPINTFGFGYDLDSNLLCNLSKIGNGVFSFIPDGTFVGTIFINALSMLFTTIAVKAKVTMTFQNDSKVTVDLGSVLFDQNRTAIAPCFEPKSIELVYVDPFKNKERTVTLENIPREDYEQVKQELMYHKIRSEFAETLHACMSDKMDEKLKAFIEKYNLPEFSSDSKVESILKDATGQGSEAFSKEEWFTKWGRHYIPSLAKAHSQQLCNNFKDPGVQNYAGKQFEKLRDELNDIFLNLPPPTPSSPHTWNGGPSGQSQPINMANYYNSRGVCFAGTCTVKMENGTKLVKDIRVGDSVRLPNMDVARVTHVVKTVFPDELTELVKFESGLHITPWHPIKVNSKWTFPVTLKAPELTKCKEVFSFALDRGHIMLINGMQCVSLGHGFTEEIVKHEYFGSSKILSDLDTISADKNQVIVLSVRDIIRDEQGGQIMGIKTN